MMTNKLTNLMIVKSFFSCHSFPKRSAMYCFNSSKLQVYFKMMLAFSNNGNKLTKSTTTTKRTLDDG